MPTKRSKKTTTKKEPTTKTRSVFDHMNVITGEFVEIVTNIWKGEK